MKERERDRQRDTDRQTERDRQRDRFIFIIIIIIIITPSSIEILSRILMTGFNSGHRLALLSTILYRLGLESVI